MSRRSPALITLFTLCALAAAAEGNPPITVRSWDKAPLGPDALRRAQAFVEHVFSRVGVALVWRWCGSEEGPECAAPVGPNDVRLRFVRRGEELAAETGDQAGGRALRATDGTAAGTIEVFEDRLQELNEDAIPLDLALGVVLAHELGHLFLPPGHSTLGLMKRLIAESDWTKAARGALRFTPDEYAVIRQRVQPRRVPLELCPPPAGLGAL